MDIIEVSNHRSPFAADGHLVFLEHMHHEGSDGGQSGEVNEEKERNDE
jgi:hypothetical protein